jgi:hypothetical protein
MRSFVESLLGLGYDSEREASLSKALVIATVFLALGSAYTTWVGLSQYVPGFVAGLLTVGVQGLLFASAWRLGGSLNTRAFRPSLALIFLVTLTTSVFFSYSALLETVYGLDARERDQMQRARLAGSALASEMDRHVRDAIVKRTSIGRQGLRVWLDTALHSVAPAISKRARDTALAEATYATLIAKAQREASGGGTLVHINGRLWVTTPAGRGDYARQYESDSDAYSVATLTPARESYALATKLKGEISTATERMLTDDSELTAANIAHLDGLREELQASLNLNSGEAVTIPAVPVDLGADAVELQALRASLPREAIGPKILTAPDVDSIKGILFAYAHEIPDIDGRTEARFLQRVDSIGYLGGTTAHPFALAIGELARLNVLAIGSLLVALSIDGLVFMCGLLAARPQSYLDMRNPDDLREMQETAIETVMSLELERIDVTKLRSAFVRRGVQILKQCDVDTELAYRGLPAVLPAAAATKLRFIEVGVLMALGIVQRLPDGALAFRTRFVLWIADRVYRSTLHQETVADFTSSIDEEYPI